MTLPFPPVLLATLVAAGLFLPMAPEPCPKARASVAGWTRSEGPVLRAALMLPWKADTVNGSKHPIPTDIWIFGKPDSSQVMPRSILVMLSPPLPTTQLAGCTLKGKGRTWFVDVKPVPEVADSMVFAYGKLSKDFGVVVMMTPVQDWPDSLRLAVLANLEVKSPF